MDAEKAEIKKAQIWFQLRTIKELIKNIENKKYYNASIIIRFDLNDKSYIWYKDINSIIQDQISNLFYDIENNTNISLDFWKRQQVKLEGRIEELNDIIGA